MPVTELGWIPSTTPGSLPPAFVEAGRKGIEVQNEWVAKNASDTLPLGPPAVRGAALYQQREDGGISLITAHWDSVAQHHAWIGSAENKGVMSEVAAAHAAMSDIRFCHVEGVAMFSVDTLDAGLLSVVRITVEGGQRGEVELVWNRSAKGVLRALAGYEHVAGWRIEKEEGKEETDEFIVVGAWRDEEALGRFVQGNEDWDALWKGVVLGVEVRTYKRVV